MALDPKKLQDCMDAVERLGARLDEHLGFKKLEHKVAEDPKVRDPGAVAAKIGMEKLGKSAFEKKAHGGD